MKVLSDPERKIDSMTVQTFAGHIQAAMWGLTTMLSLHGADKFIGTTSKSAVWDPTLIVLCSI